MRKRPLCLAAVLCIVIQAVLVGGLRIAKDLKPSGLELAGEEGDCVSLEGTVGRREEKPKYQVYYLTDNQIRLGDQIIEESKILVYIKREESLNTQNQQIAVGNTIYLTGEVSFFQEAANPGNFDMKFYYQKQGIHASVWADKVEIRNPKVWRIREWLARFRSRWKEGLTECMGSYYGNIMSGILLGDKSELDSDTKVLYQKSGIGHILAISGLHMSFLGIGFYRLLRKAGMPFLPAGSIGILCLLLYTMMVGCGVSSLRALMMFTVRMGAEITGRTYDMPTSLSLAAAVIVLWQPLYLLDAGFLLSFGAIVGILAVSPVLEHFQVLPGVLCASSGIHLMLLPIMLYYYFEIPVYSMLLNLLVVPLMSVVLGVGVLGSGLAVFWGGAGEAVLQVCKGILWGYEKMCLFTMHLPFGRMVPGRPGKGWIALYYILLLAGCVVGFKMIKADAGQESDPIMTSGADKVKASGADGVKMFDVQYRMKGKKQENGRRKQDRRKKRERISLRAASAGLAVFFCIICSAGHGRAGELRVTMLDVGQGDSLYVRTPSGCHCLIDGGSTDVSKVGVYRIEPFLKSQGVGRLHYVFISHGDADHINGIQEMLENQFLGISIDTLVLPPENVWDDALRELARTALKVGTRAAVIQEGQQVKDGEMLWTCLAPAQNYSGEIGNASSMVLSLEYGEFDMLFTGDVEGGGEEALTGSGLLKDYDVLKAAHHGSKNSSIEQFLEVTRPEITLISAGRDNRYGHPHAEAIKRLEALDSRIFSTQTCGAVTLRTDGKTIRIERFIGIF